MTEIFKYFFGIIGALILVYVLIVLFRTVSLSFLNTMTDKNVQTAVATTTTTVLNETKAAATGFTFQKFLSDFKPSQVTPGSVVPDERKSMFYGFESQFDNEEFRNSMYWGNAANAPDSHPTDYIPLGGSFSERYDNSKSYFAQDNQDGYDPAYARLINLSIREGDVIENPQVITGSAHYTLFKERSLMLYVMDSAGNTLGAVKAFSNGTINKGNLFVPFRAVVYFDNPNSQYGYILIRNENSDIVGVKVLKSVKIAFNSGTQKGLDLIFPTQKARLTEQCVIGGCSMNLCLSQEEVKYVSNTCEWSPSYACYKTAKCGFDKNQGRCSWIVDNQLAQCLQDAR